MELLRSLGPRVEPPARVLELACGDGTFGRLLLDAGFEYSGVDASAGMVDAARAKLGADKVDQADFASYRPRDDVDITVCFNALYYAADRVELLRAIRAYTRVKVLFDFIPRDHPAESLVADARTAGFEHVRLRPFFVPQTYTLPRPAQAALEVAERVPPVARAILRRRFAYVAAVW